MKRIFIYTVLYTALFLVGFFFCPFIWSQSSVTSITAQDTSGQLWLNGTLTYTFQGNGSFNGTYQWNGADLPAQYLSAQTINLNSSAVGTFTVPSSSAITPAGSSWKITVCPNATVNCVTNAIPISGATPDISSTINPTLPPISITGAPLPLAYQDNQVKTSIRTGSLYYDTTPGQGPKYYDGSIWQLFGGAASGSVVINPIGNQFINQPSGTAFGVNGNSVFNSLNAPVGNPATGPDDDTSGILFKATWTLPTINNGFSQTQSGVPIVCNFQSPGWNFGNQGGLSGISSWSIVKCVSITNTIGTQGIGQTVTVRHNKYANGDSGGFYLYPGADGGNTDVSGEGVVGLSVQGGQNTTWMHGTVGTGATTGTTHLPIVPNSSLAFSRTQTSTGGFMLDISRPVISGHTTGSGALVSGMAVYQIPVDVSVTESTAWGNLTTDIPNNIPATATGSVSEVVNVLGGTNSAGYTTGLAWLAGQQNPEQVIITAVGTLSAGHQTVIFNHIYPNTAAGSSLWQGGTQGFFSNTYFNNLLGSGSWRTAYYVFGATDTSHLVGGFIVPVNWSPITTISTGQTYQVPLVNLSGNGTTVTAAFGTAFTGISFGNLSSAVISGSTGCDGTVSNIQIGPISQNTPNFITWNSSTCTSSVSAFISYPQSAFAFTVYPGATVIQPKDPITGLIPLEPNNVAWTPGDTIENPFNPSFTGGLITTSQFIGSPDSLAQVLPSGQNTQLQGLGISGAYVQKPVINLNPCQIYSGCGGQLILQPHERILGPNAGAINNAEAPLPGTSMLTMGCMNVVLGGCSNVQPQQFGALQNGSLYWLPATSQLQSSGGFDSLGKATIRTLGTGNGATGANGMYLTSANGFGTFINTDLNEYSNIGNGGSLDLSGGLGIANLYNPSLYIGAKPPTSNTFNQGGVTGTTAYTYVCTALTSNGESLPSVSFTLSSGNAVLSSTNFISPVCSAGLGGEGINIYRVSGSTYNSGLICHSTNNTDFANFQFSGSSCKDSGQTATGSIPTVDTSGSIKNGLGNANVYTFGTPASSSAPCTVPRIEYDASFIYTCVATNTWTRVATTTF